MNVYMSSKQPLLSCLAASFVKTLVRAKRTGADKGKREVDVGNVSGVHVGNVGSQSYGGIKLALQFRYCDFKKFEASFFATR